MQTENREKPMPRPRRGKAGSVLGWTVLLIVLVIAVFAVAGELIFRHGAVPLPAGAKLQHISSVRLRDLDGDFEVVAIDVGKVHGVQPALEISISFWSMMADFEISLVGPNDDVMWREEYNAKMARVSTPKISFETAARGQWRLILSGRARNLMLSVTWKIDE